MEGQCTHTLGHWKKDVHDLYTVIYPFISSADGRTRDTFFRYKYGEDGEVKDGEVRAVADGSLLLKTSKQSNPNKYCVWDRQFAALTFEVFHPVEPANRRQRKWTCVW